MNKFQLHYGVQNGGDGSAYPRFFESRELATWDQDHMYEGWGEDCSGTIELESESPIICKEHIITKEEYLLNRYHGNEEFENEFLKQFFPDGFPNTFIVITEKLKNCNGYLNNHIYLNDKFLYSEFHLEADSGEILQDKINLIRNKE